MVNIIPSKQQHVSITIVSMLSTAKYSLTEQLKWLYVLLFCLVTIYTASFIFHIHFLEGYIKLQKEGMGGEIPTLNKICIVTPYVCHTSVLNCKNDFHCTLIRLLCSIQFSSHILYILRGQKVVSAAIFISWLCA